MGIERLRYGHRAFMFIGSRTRSWVGKRKEARVAKVIERVEARYEVQDVEMGKVYRWRPESVVVECEECGENLTLSASKHTCEECGADHRPVVEEVLEAPPKDTKEEVVHPWRSLRPYYSPTRGT
jgi:hypothetical protein